MTDWYEEDRRRKLAQKQVEYYPTNRQLVQVFAGLVLGLAGLWMLIVTVFSL